MHLRSKLILEMWQNIGSLHGKTTTKLVQDNQKVNIDARRLVQVKSKHFGSNFGSNVA